MLDLLPTPLKEDYLRNRWLPFVGAGFSRNAVLPGGHVMPSWDVVAKRLRTGVTTALSDPIDVITAYEKSYGRGGLTERLNELLYTRDARPGEAHREFCALPFDYVCTTNWDSLLEAQYDRDDNPCFPLVVEKLLNVRPPPNQTVLMKLHGDLKHEYVATHEDYDGYLEANPLFVSYFTTMLLQRTPVFIGYGLRDRNLASVMRLIATRVGRHARPAYAFMVKPTKADVEWFKLHKIEVVDLPGQNPGHTLAALFRELREMWEDKALAVAHAIDGELAPELALPGRHRGRLCYVSVPMQAAAWYERNVFPVIRINGYLPVARAQGGRLRSSGRSLERALMRRCGMGIVELPDDLMTQPGGHAVVSHIGDHRVVVVAGDGDTDALRGYPNVLSRDIGDDSPLTDDRDGRAAFQRALHDCIGAMPGVEINLSEVVEEGQEGAALVAAVGVLQTTIGRATRDHVVIGGDEGLGRDELLEVAVRLAILTSVEASRVESLIGIVGSLAVDEAPPAAHAAAIVDEVKELCQRIEARSNADRGGTDA